MPDHDVLVVGGGPVGLLFACLMAQSGRRVVVCERRVAADTRTRAIGIHRPGLHALETAGIGADVRAEALWLSAGEVRSRGRVLATLSFGAERPILILPQPRTHALLRDRLQALDPAALQLGRLVRSVRDEGPLVRVRVDGPEGEEEVTASTVVVADGVRSPLRRAFGAGWTRRGGHAAYAMLDVDDPDAGRRAVLYCEQEGLVESFPLPGGRRRWVIRQDPRRPVSSTADFCGTVQARTGERIDPPLASTPSRFVAAQHVARRMQCGRIVLLGDAAHEVSPIGGQGMNLGWMHALQLAAALSTTAGERSLAAFERRAHRGARIAQRRAAFFMAMGTPVVTPMARGRELSIRAFGLPPLREGMANLITMHGL